MAKMINRQYKCPVCGAPVDGEKCEYCGCVIYDFADISTEEPRYIRLMTRQPDGHMCLLQMKAIAVNPCIEMQFDSYDIADAKGEVVGRFQSGCTCKMTVEFQGVIESDKLYTVTLFDKPYRESWRDDIE